MRRRRKRKNNENEKIEEEEEGQQIEIVVVLVEAKHLKWGGGDGKIKKNKGGRGDKGLVKNCAS